MSRLTQKETSGRWQMKGVPWERLGAGQMITEGGQSGTVRMPLQAERL